MKSAFFFPGQGSQSLNMMDGFADMAVVRETFEEASQVAGTDFWHMLTEESAAGALNNTVNTQPVMLAAGIAVWRVYRVLGGQNPAVLAGHSLGEYTALTAAGSLDFADAVALVRLRAELMQKAVPAGEGAMAAVLGLDDETVIRLCAEAEADGSANEVAEAVNFNSPGQVVIAGSAAAVARAGELMKTAGAKRVLPLPVSVPSHCRLMKPAADRLAEALADIGIRVPEIPVIHNADVCVHRDTAAIKEALVRQLYSPVPWTETVQWLLNDGVSVFAECGPGKVLAGLTKRIDKTAVCAALTDTQAVRDFIDGGKAA